MENGKGCSPINTDAIVASSQQARSNAALPFLSDRPRLSPDQRQPSSGTLRLTWHDCAQSVEVSNAVSGSLHPG